MSVVKNNWESYTMNEDNLNETYVIYRKSENNYEVVSYSEKRIEGTIECSSCSHKDFLSTSSDDVSLFISPETWRRVKEIKGFVFYKKCPMCSEGEIRIAILAETVFDNLALTAIIVERLLIITQSWPWFISKRLKGDGFNIRIEKESYANFTIKGDIIAMCKGVPDREYNLSSVWSEYSTQKSRGVFIQDQLDWTDRIASE